MNTETITLRSLAERFRRFTNWDHNEREGEGHCIAYENNNSFGNRRINWKGVWAHKNYDGDGNVITKERVYEETRFQACEWSQLFDGIHYGFIVGPETLLAVEECLEILRNDVPPEDDGQKVRHVNRLGGVNWLDKPTFHSWNLTDRLGKILSSAFFSDRKNKLLYSEAFTYVFNSFSGWSRSS